jgi:hypothetical protein
MAATEMALTFIRDEDLADKAALYGQPAIDAELARRRSRRTVDLRGDDRPAPDPWDAERARAGGNFDPVAAAGLRVSAVTYGDPFAREAARREQERRRQSQRTRYEVAIGAVIMLRDGARLAAGAALTPELVDHPHAIEVIDRLVERGYVSGIDPHLAWLRSLDPAIGPYVVVAETLQVGARMLHRGQGVSEKDFPALELPRRITDETPVSALTVRDLRRLIVEEIDAAVPRQFNFPPPQSQFDAARFSHAIELAPNYVPTQRKAEQ